MSKASEGMSEKATELLRLARKKFGELSETEEELFRSFADGEIADYSGEREGDNDPAKADKWGLLDADRISWLCTDREASAMATHRGIMVKGARIEGELDLAFTKIPFPLYFEKSAFSGVIHLEHAEIKFLFLGGTHTGPMWGGGLKVEGSIYLRGGFTAEGEVSLVGATIEGDLDCNGGKFINKGARALSANRANIKANVFLHKDFRAEGEVDLTSATIGGDLDCEKGQFIKEGARALYADGSNIKGCVFLRGGFTAQGEVNLVGATIGGDLSCIGGRFINKRAYALNASSMKVKGHVYLRDGFKADGVVDLSTTTIDGGLQWRDVDSPERVKLSLSSVTVGVLWDDKDSWPDPGKLLLHGFDYNDLADSAPRDANSRIDWLRRQKDFSPQPYEQLAGVLRKGGQDEDAKKILIAKNKDKAWLTKLTFTEKCWYRVFGPMIGYGYRPLRALWGVLIFVVLGWILFGTGYLGGLVAPESDSAFAKGDKGISIPGDERKLSEVYPRFNFLIYSVDTFVPLIDLHQSKYWLPNANRGYELFKIKYVSLHVGGLLRFYLWIHIVMGWALTTLLVVGLTGLVRT